MLDDSPLNLPDYIYIHDQVYHVINPITYLAKHGILA